MEELHFVGIGGTKVVASGLEGVPHEAVTCGGPIERRRTCHTAVDPVVGVFDGNALSAVAETSVLYASAIEVFAVVAGECKCSLGIVDGDGCGLPHHLAAILCDVQETGGAVNADIHGGSAHDVFCIGGLQL